VQAAIAQLLHDEAAKQKAKNFSKVVAKWDGPNNAAELLYQKYGTPTPEED
jgi:UDP:flavonoid glycosyltransferase YjiC (YdhE family)